VDGDGARERRGVRLSRFRALAVAALFVLASCTATTRVSVSSNEVEGNGASNAPALSAGGRYAAFSSEASNLVTNDTNGVSDAFVRDTVGGTTERASLTNADAQLTRSSYANAISASGRYVLFSSGSTDLDVQVFLRDRTEGTTTLVSRRADGTPADRGSFGRTLSPDGRYALFTSTATDLPGDTDPATSVFRFDRTTGIVSHVVSPACPPDTTSETIQDVDEVWGTGVVAFAHLCDFGLSGGSASLYVLRPNQQLTRLATISSQQAQITLDWASDGSILAWTEYTASSRSSTELAELKTWNGTNEPEVIDTPGGAFDVAVNGDGRYLAFTTQDHTEEFLYFGFYRIAVIDRVTGERAVASTNLQGNVPDEQPDPSRSLSGSRRPAIDEHGTTVGFTSDMRDIVFGDTNDVDDVFTRPLSSMFGSDSTSTARASR
jgi:hypothetical protein